MPFHPWLLNISLQKNDYFTLNKTHLTLNQENKGPQLPPLPPKNNFTKKLLG